MAKRKSLFFLLITIVSLLATGLAPVVKVFAAITPIPTSFTWIDRTYIKAGNEYFRPIGTFDTWGGGVYMPEKNWSAITDSNNFTNFAKIKSECLPFITVDNFDKDGTTGVYINQYKPVDGSGCKQDSATKITIDRADRRFVTAYRVDNNNIYLPIYKSYRDSFGGQKCENFTATEGYFKRRPPDSLKYKIELERGVIPHYANGQWDNLDRMGVEIHTKDNTMYARWTDLISCTDSKPLTFANNGTNIDPGTVDSKYAAVKDTAINGNGASATGTPQVDCSWSWNPLTWVMCPLLDFTQNIINQVGSFITGQLNIDANKYLDKNCDANSNTGCAGKQIYSAWNSVRLISMGFLVIIALVMVIAQALSLEIIDAYTVRKVLPRLVAAVIAISLSWELLRLAIIVSNDLAKAVQSIILLPFGKISTPELAGAQLTMGAVGVVAAGAALGALGLLSFLLAAAVALIIAFFAIVLRQIMVVFLVIVAPLAIIAAILPNTQKAWKLWHTSFSGALLVYTIIAGFIALGAAFGRVAGAAGGNDAAAPFIALIATYIPYFLIPKAFSMAGGLVGNLAGMVNDRGRGAFDRLKGFRKAQASKNWESIKAGNRFKGEGALSRRLSHGLQTASLAGQAGLDPRKWQARVRSARSARTSALAAEAEKSVAARAVIGNDDLLAAALHGRGTEADARAYLQNIGQRGRELDQNVASITQARRDVGRENFADLAAANLAGTGTGYGGGPAEMLETINRVAGTDRARAARILAAARGQAERARRVDLYGAGFATSADQMAQLAAGQTNADAVNEVMTDEALNSKSAGEIGTSRNNAVRNMAGAMQRRLARAQVQVNAARAVGDTGLIAQAEHVQKQALAAAASFVDVAGSASPENAQVLGALNGQAHEMDEYVTQMVLDPASGTRVARRVRTGNKVMSTVGQAIEDLRTDTEFQQYRREYGSAQAAAVAGGGMAGPPGAAGGGGPPAGTGS